MNDLWLDSTPIQVQVQGLTDPGRLRSENQDNYLVANLSAPSDHEGAIISADGDGSQPLGRFELGPKGLLLLVADGMGGAAAGHIASKMAAGWIAEEFIEKWSAERINSPDRFIICLRDAVAAANSMVHQQANRYPQYRGMGTTVTAAGILDGTLYIAQVGDSRAYLIREAVATQLTRDQSLVQELIDAGTLTEEDAEKSQHRSVILQAVGVAPDIKVDLTYQEFRRDDVVLLCSDGLTRLVRKEEIARAAADLPSPSDLCRYLVGLANERGGPDNVTVLIARLSGQGLDTPMTGDVVARRGYTPRPS